MYKEYWTSENSQGIKKEEIYESIKKSLSNVLELK